MAVAPPSVRVWWNEPIARTELVWMVIAFLWGVIMFFTMIFWHVFGEQNLSNETYKINPETYVAKVDAMVEQYTVREEEGFPVVRPPPGSDVYLLARAFQFYPLLELEKGKAYRMHLSSADVQHGFSLQPVNINISVHPGYDHVFTVTPTTLGEHGIVCNEYCGLGHHTMIGKIYVTEQEGAGS
ncbi:MAG: cytochrome C oxidase subunit II [Gammaproteobacteria bacterium]|nr:MAG: cytochrome C oxidase subunit II [Gammaproteobacteria bacterium]